MPPIPPAPPVFGWIVLVCTSTKFCNVGRHVGWPATLGDQSVLFLPMCEQCLQSYFLPSYLWECHSLVARRTHFGSQTDEVYDLRTRVWQRTSATVGMMAYTAACHRRLFIGTSDFLSTCASSRSSRNVLVMRGADSYFAFPVCFLFRSTRTC